MTVTCQVQGSVRRIRLRNGRRAAGDHGRFDAACFKTGGVLKQPSDEITVVAFEFLVRASG